LIASIATPLLLWGLGLTQMAGLVALLSGLLILKHHANIRRLLSGTESKIGAKA
jgi:glycerol-3-phosphate acyltransferase PlsY